MPQRPSRSAFSFVEILVAVTIIAFLGGVIYATFAQGLRIWQRIQAARPEVDIELLVEKITADLRNAFMFADRNMKGHRHLLSFYTLSHIDSASLGGNPTRLGAPLRVTYEYHGKSKSVSRTYQTYEQVLREDDSLGGSRVLARDVSNFDLEYYYYDRSREKYVWQHSWDEACLPQAVKVSEGHGEGAYGKSSVTFVQVPAGGCEE